jgi:hypothetical protein
MIANIDPIAGTAQDFARLTEALQTLSRRSNELEALEVKMNEQAQKSAGAFAADYVVLQEALAKLDGIVKELFAAHPEWRGPNKSVKTPFGEVSQRSVTELDVPNEAMTVALIEAQFSEAAADYLHIDKAPNLEALERLGDDALAKLGVQRKKREQVTVKPASVSVAKAVKAAKAKAE